MTRQPAPVTPPVVTTIAGSDSGGGAGIQADLKTIEAGGGFGTSVVTAVTAQHTRGVERTHVLPIEEIEAQYSALQSDFDVAAAKTGMLATREVVDFVTEQFADSDTPLVVDPVMVAASGDRLLDEDAELAYESLARAARCSPRTQRRRASSPGSTSIRPPTPNGPPKHSSRTGSPPCSSRGVTSQATR